MKYKNSPFVSTLGLLRASWLPMAFSLACLAVSWWLIPVALCGLLDLIARLRERYYIKRMRYSTLLARHMRHSRCQREVMLSVHPEAAELYRSLGYRWWHLVPDKLLSNPLEFFMGKNLRKVLGV